MPNTFPIRNLIPESSSYLVSHSMCLRGGLIDKYSSFTRIFICFVKQIEDSDYFQNPFSKQKFFSFQERKQKESPPRGHGVEKRGFSQW